MGSDWVSAARCRVRGAAMRLALVAFAVATAVLPTVTLRAQAAAVAACRADPNRLATASGRRIGAVIVATRGPASLPGGLGAPLHVTTRESTIRSRLLFAAGDTVDTLRVAESVRQLRRLRYLAGAVVTPSCDGAGGVVLTVTTRDAWSMKPRLAARGSASAMAGLEETNLFGTGRAARVYVRSERAQFGVGAGYTDPTLFSSRILGAASRDVYRDGGAWAASLRSADVGVFERLGFGLSGRQSARLSVAGPARAAPGVAPGDTVRRATVALLVRRRLTYTPLGATYLLGGVEGERTMLVAGADLPLAGPPTVRRTFAGLDLGLARRSGRYDEVPWLLPQARDGGARFAPAEIPVGVEGEAVVAFGRDFTAQRPATHVDLWAGRIWNVGGMTGRWSGGETGATSAVRTPRTLLSSDLWASGYRSFGVGGGEWSAGALRGSLALVAPARRGLWSARLSGERLFDPDPDVRSLAMADPVLRAIPPGSRLAETALSASIERSVHLLGARRGYVLDGALFGAGSLRWDAASRVSLAARAAARADPATDFAGVSGGEQLYVGSIGLGLRLVPTRFGRSTLGLDVGIPVVRSAQVRRRVYIGVSITPAFGSRRRRDGASP